MHKGGTHFLDRMGPQEVVHLPPDQDFKKEQVLDDLVIERKLIAETQCVPSPFLSRLLDSSVEEKLGNLPSP